MTKKERCRLHMKKWTWFFRLDMIGLFWFSVITGNQRLHYHVFLNKRILHYTSYMLILVDLWFSVVGGILHFVLLIIAFEWKRRNFVHFYDEAEKRFLFLPRLQEKWVESLIPYRLKFMLSEQEDVVERILGGTPTGFHWDEREKAFSIQLSGKESDDLFEMKIFYPYHTDEYTVGFLMGDEWIHEVVVDFSQDVVEEDMFSQWIRHSRLCEIDPVRVG